MGKLKDKFGNKKVILASSDSTGCGGYRTYYPYLFLKDNFEWIEHFFGFPSGNPIIHEADVVFIQRATHEFFPPWIKWMQSVGKRVVYDIDDNLWAIPSANLAHRHYPPRELKKVDAVINACDCITTSTLPLKKFLEERFQKQVFYIPNHIWHRDLEVKPKNEKVQIGWAGSYTHNGDFDHHLVNVLRNLPKDKVDIFCVGFHPQYLKPFSTLVPWIDFKEYHEKFCALNWDIGVIVAEENLFNRCKSNIKYLEYSQARCVSVAHGVYPYSTTIDDGVDGFLVNNTKYDWKSHIYRLIEDEPFRLKMADKAYEKIKAQFTYEFDDIPHEYRYLELFEYLYRNEQ